jgi:hypothetical protein
LNAPIESSPLACPACGAPQPVPPPDRRYVRCEHCGTTAFVSLGGLRRHLVAEPALKPGDATGEARAAGAATSTHVEMRYHPFWEFTAAGRTLALDAAPDAPPGLTSRTLAGGQRRAAEPRDEPALEKPSLRPGAAAAEASERLQVSVEEAQATLVHHPLFLVGLPGGAELWVDGVEGGIVHGEVTRSGGVAFPLFAVVAAAACGLLLPPPLSFLGAMVVGGWSLRRYVGL